MTRGGKQVRHTAWSLGDLIGSSGRRIATVGLMLLSISMAVNFGELVVRGAEIQQKIERQRAVNIAHEAEKQRLEAQLAYFRSPVHVEMVAREQLGYARDGDTVILPSVALVSPAPEPPKVQALPAPLPTPNWQKWWQALFPKQAE